MSEPKKTAPRKGNRGRELHPDQVEAFKADTLLGLNDAVVAVKYGLGGRYPGNTLQSWRKKLHIWRDENGEPPWAKQMRQWWADDVPIAEMCARTQLTRHHMMERIALLKLVKRPVDYTSSRIPWDAARREEFARDWSSEMPLPEMCAKYKLTHSKLLERRKDYKLPVRAFAGGPWTEAEDEILTDLYMKGATSAGIADVLPNRSAEAVQDRVHRLKLTRRMRRGRDLPTTVAAKIEECLAQHGRTPTWRLRDYVGVKDMAVVHKALRHLQRRGKVVSPTKGQWEAAQ